LLKYIKYKSTDKSAIFSQIQLLVLDDNQLEVLPSPALARLVVLHDLHLTRNKLIELPRHLPNGLRGLYLGYNRIARLSLGPLRKLSRLRDLVISHNLIQVSYLFDLVIGHYLIQVG